MASDHLPVGTIIVSEEGQALHYVLKRPVVSIIEPPEFSNGATDGPGFRELMSRYKSRYLLLFPTIRGSQNRLPYLQDLVGSKGPDWLKLSVSTHDVAVYECESCIRKLAAEGSVAHLESLHELIGRIDLVSDFRRMCMEGFGKFVRPLRVSHSGPFLKRCSQRNPSGGGCNLDCVQARCRTRAYRCSDSPRPGADFPSQKKRFDV